MQECASAFFFIKKIFSIQKGGVLLQAIEMCCRRGGWLGCNNESECACRVAGFAYAVPICLLSSPALQVAPKFTNSSTRAETAPVAPPAALRSFDTAAMNRVRGGNFLPGVADLSAPTVNSNGRPPASKREKEAEYGIREAV